MAEPIEMPLLGPKSLRFFLLLFLDFWFRALEREKKLFAKYITKQKINNKNSTMAGYQKRH